MGANTKDEQLRVKTLLSDTVTLLCKNGLAFKKNLKVQGLLGITVDDDEVFIVHLNETLGDLVSASDENQTEECQTPSKSSESGRRSPNRRKRRRSRDTVRSPTPQESQDSIIDLDPDIEIKADPDAILVDEVKFEGSPSKQSCRLADEGLNLAINSISSLDQSFPGGNASLSTTPNRPGFRSFDTSMSGNSTTTSAASPYITAMVPNVADPSQSPGSSSFQWDSSSAQGLPGMSSWASQASAQVAQQTMSQPGTSQGSPGGYNPEQRTGTDCSYAWDPNCRACQYFVKKRRHRYELLKLQKRGVALSDIPTFTESRVSANDFCASCVKRKAHWRKLTTKYRSIKKGEKQNISSDSQMSE